MRLCCMEVALHASRITGCILRYTVKHEKATLLYLEGWQLVDADLLGHCHCSSALLDFSDMAMLPVLAMHHKSCRAMTFSILRPG